MTPRTEATEGSSTILDAMMKVDREIEEEISRMDSDSDREANSSSNDTGLSPSTDPSTSRGTGVGRDDDSSGMSIAHTENKAVRLWKIVVVLVLVASTVGVAITVFLYVSREEQAEFEASFADDSLKVFEAVGNALDVKLAAIDAFVTSIVSFAKATNMTWPFVTVPDFAIRASKVRGLAHAMSISQLQVVWNELDREMWEDNYVGQNNGWVQEGIDVQRTDPAFQGDLSIPDYEGNDGINGIWYGESDNVVPPNFGP